MAKEKAQKQTKEQDGQPTPEQPEELVYEKGKDYPIEEAVELAKKMSKTKFDASIEVAFNLGIDPKKGDQQVRSVISLPHGTGKNIKVAAFVESDKEQEAKDAGADGCIFGNDERGRMIEQKHQ